MTRWHVVAVLQLDDDERDAAEKKQPNRDHNPDDQTQMTSFEINLKDKRFVEGFMSSGAFRIFICSFYAPVKLI